MKNDYLIVLSYFLVLIAGTFIGIFASTSANTFTIVKDIASILFPFFGLLIATLGLNNWKKAERLKMICKFANEVRTSCKDDYKKLLVEYNDLMFLIRKEKHLSINENYPSANSLRSSNVIRCGQVDEQARLLLEVYKEHFDELYSIDEKFIIEIKDLETKFTFFNRTKIEVEYRNEPEKLYLKRVEHTKELTLRCSNIYQKLVTISGANS